MDGSNRKKLHMRCPNGYKSLTKFPVFHLDLNRILNTADYSGRSDVLTMPSELDGVCYIADAEEIIVGTSGRGYIRMPIDAWKTITDELSWMYELQRTKYGRGN